MSTPHTGTHGLEYPELPMPTFTYEELTAEPAVQPVMLVRPQYPKRVILSGVTIMLVVHALMVWGLLAVAVPALDLSYWQVLAGLYALRLAALTCTRVDMLTHPLWAKYGTDPVTWDRVRAMSKARRDEESA